MGLKKHRRVLLAILRHQGGTLTISKDDRALRDLRLAYGRMAEQRQGVMVAAEDERTVTYRLLMQLVDRN